MTLAEVIGCIERAARQQPAVQTVVPHDVLDLNSMPDVRYGVFAWAQTRHRGQVLGMDTYGFALFYADRLTDGATNLTAVQSTGAAVLQNVARTLQAMGLYPGEWTIEPFRHRFADDCGGMMMTVDIRTEAVTVCEERYTDTAVLEWSVPAVAFAAAGGTEHVAVAGNVAWEVR